MAFLDRFRRAAQDSPREIRAADFSGFIAPRYATFADAYGGSGPASAVEQSSAVYACVSFLADVFGSLPMHLYREGENGRERIRSTDADRNLPGIGYPGSLAKILGELPNPEMSSQTMWETVIGHGALWGTASVNVQRINGRPVAIWPLRPDRIKRKRDVNGRIYYEYLVPDGVGGFDKRILLPSEVMQIPWFGTDGYQGISAIGVARRGLGVLGGAERFAESWYANSATPSSIVTIPKGPQEKFKERSKVTRDALQQMHGGMDNSGRLAVVEEGVTWQAVAMPMDDMQFLETRKFQLADIARIFRIPQYLLDPEKTSSWGSGVEQQFLGMLTTTGRPIMRRIEAACNKDLGADPGVKTLLDEGIYPEFLFEDLLRTDTESRYKAYALAVTNRIMSPAYVAQIENLPYDPERPSDYENPNTTAPPEAAPSDPPDLQLVENDSAREALLLSLAARMAEPPQQMQLPNIEVNPAPVNVFNKDMTGEVREAVESITPPVVNVDLAPVAKMVGEVAARQILEAQKAEERAEERHRETLEAMKPPAPVRMTRKVTRDANGLIELVEDIPEEEIG